MIDETDLARAEFCGRNTFILGLVRQHWPRRHIPNGVNARSLRLEIMANFNLPAGIDLNARLGQIKSFGIGATTDRDKHAIRFNRFGSTARRWLNRHGRPDQKNTTVRSG